MKPIPSNLFKYFFFAFLFMACSSQKASSNPKKDNLSTNSQSSNQETKNFIDLLNQMKTALNENDREEIATWFDYPINENQLFLIDDATYGNTIEINSKFDFLNNYNAFYKSEFFDDLKNILNALNFEQLNKTNKITAEHFSTSEPCYQNYFLSRENEIAAFKLTQQVNQNFTQPEDIDFDELSNVSENCESEILWYFDFSDGSVKFEKITGAG